MNPADDLRLLDSGLGWSNEVRRFEQILTRGGQHSRGEVQRVGETILRLLPDAPPYQPYRAAVARLLAAERAAMP